MSNYDRTILNCSNTAAVEACAGAINNRVEPFALYKVDYQKGDMEIYAKTCWGVPHEKIKEVSKQFPDDVITCRYSFDADGYIKVFVVEYSGGNDKEVNLEPNYIFSIIPLNNAEDRDAIFKKTISFCHKLDTTQRDKDGNLFIDWFKEKVCYTFEYVSAESVKYRIEVTKDFYQLDFKVHEYHVRNAWHEISNNVVGIPF